MALAAAALVLASASAHAEQRIGDALAAFRALTGQQAVWSHPARLQSLLQQLDGLRDDGLDPAAYGADALRAGAHPACLETLATLAYLHALDDLAHGRLDAAEVEPLWHSGRAPARHSPLALAQLAADGLHDLAAGFDAARPSLPVYAALRSHMAALRSLTGTPEPDRLPDGLTLRSGMQHPAVDLLRARLARHGFELQPEQDAMHFDAALAALVGRFQFAHNLQPDGVVGRATRAALNQDVAERVARTQANLERWRWLAAELRETQVRVDIAAAELRYLRDGELRWMSRVQVGRSERATPLLSSALNQVTLNPAWVVPPTILRQDKLPAIRANPAVLAESGLRVFDRSGAELNPADVDWNAPGPITLRQDPGPLNALGQVALRFPNPFSVYLHDTPSQLQFTSWQRTFSSGCVRVERAMELAELLLQDAAGIGGEALATALGSGQTRNLALREPVPILIAYWTADVDADGALRWRPDSYAHDAAIAAALWHAPPHPLPRCAP